MNPDLSILICAIPERLDHLRRLMQEMNEQVRSCGKSVEILALVDNRQLTVGEKRNRLVRSAAGDYVAFIDDDDWVHSHYIIRLMQALRHQPDVVTFPVEVILNGGPPKPCYYSIHYPDQGECESYYWRWPNHLCVIRRELMLAHPFPAVNFGEDTCFATAIRPALKKEVNLNGQPFYQYRFSSQRTTTQRFDS